MCCTPQSPTDSDPNPNPNPNPNPDPNPNPNPNPSDPEAERDRAPLRKYNGVTEEHDDEGWEWPDEEFPLGGAGSAEAGETGSPSSRLEAPARALRLSSRCGRHRSRCLLSWTK